MVTTGTAVYDEHYTPWGTARDASQQAAVPYRYTVQREETALGLYDYGARWYDPSIGRFIQADSIVPEPGNPQSLNSYSYVRNNPLRYTDPTGRIEQDEADIAYDIIKRLSRDYDVSVEIDFGWQDVIRKWNEGFWKLSDLVMFARVVKDFATALGGADSFKKAFGSLGISKRSFPVNNEDNYSHAGDGLVDFRGFGFITPWEAFHELAHTWDAHQGWSLSEELLRDTFGKIDANGVYHAGLRPPTTYDPLNPREDWSDSVAAFFMPDEAEIQTIRNTGSPTLYGTYFDKSVRALIVADIISRYK
jgi:RHS repeat-associated protein